MLLRYGLERSRACPVYAPGGRRGAPRARWSRTGATRSTWHAIDDGDKARRSARSTCAFSRTDHPPPTFAVEATGADGRRLVYTADTGPGVERRRVRRRARTSCSPRRATSTTTSAIADPPLRPTRPAPRRARRKARSGSCSPTSGPRSTRQCVGRGRIRGVRRGGHARRRRPHAHRDLTHRAPTTHDLTSTKRVLMGIRNDGREPDQLRPLAFTRDYTELAMGSVLVEMGRTRVLCTASVEERVPPWLRGTGKGWVTAEYSMLPGSTPGAGRPRGGEGQAERPHPGDPAAHRPLAARGDRSRRCSARCRSPSTATRSRPTAARAPRRSAAASSRCTTRARGSSQAKKLAGAPDHRTCARRSRSAWSRRCRASTSTTPRTRPPRST